MNRSRRKFLLAAGAGLALLAGCKERSKSGPEAVHWDRDMCERCKMVLSERKYAAEIVNPKTGKTYKFDDIGCAVLWMDEEHIPWKDRAKIWVTDAKTGRWIDARKALYTDDSITPMAYGIAAFTQETFPKGHKALTFKQAAEVIRRIEAKNNELRGVKP
jgi:nitrous oxide reductase accessory protein NosL